jgi:chaperone modulatory protein CbpM
MPTKILKGVLIDEQTQMSLADICRACSRHAEWVIELVDEGVLEPVGPSPEHWYFSAMALQRALVAARLQRDLGINLAGIALVLDLLEEIETLRTQLRGPGR